MTIARACANAMKGIRGFVQNGNSFKIMQHWQALTSESSANAATQTIAKAAKKTIVATIRTGLNICDERTKRTKTVTKA